MLKEAQYYQIGDIVRFGRNYQMMAAQKGEYMQVVDKGKLKNTLILQKADGTQITWQPHKHSKVEVYNAEIREIGQGEVIRFTRNSDLVKNGELARVINITGQHSTLEIGQGKDKTFIKMDLTANKYWDYGYASTVHAAQGRTTYRTFFYMPVPENTREDMIKSVDLAKMAKVFGERSFYVGATRASHQLTIYTHDKQVAALILGAKQDKSSVVETIEKNLTISVGKHYKTI